MFPLIAQADRLNPQLQTAVLSFIDRFYLLELLLLVIGFVFLIFLLNIKSWPFVWHLRIFKPAFTTKLNWFRVWFGFETKDQVLERLSPVGANPFEYEVKYESRAGFDDCDFHFHMSNSAYAKVVDAAIMKTLISSFPEFFQVGGWMPMVATNFHFHHQIPLLVKYELRMRIGGWDEKWIYFISDFRTKGKEEVVPVSERLLYSYNSDSSASFSDTSSTHRKTFESSERKEQQKEKKPNAIALTKMCFKIGRITVPPAIVLALSGFSSPPPPSPHSISSNDSESKVYSHTNPPPYYTHVRKLKVEAGGDDRKVRAFLIGGWRNIEKGGRWWEDALQGVEKRRKEGLGYVRQVGSGMEALERLCA